MSLPDRSAIAICKACRFYRELDSIRRCIKFTRPCSTAKLWRGELDPPEGCPSRQQLLAVLDAGEITGPSEPDK